MKIKVSKELLRHDTATSPGRLVLTVPSVEESLGSKTELKDNFTPNRVPQSVKHIKNKHAAFPSFGYNT